MKLRRHCGVVGALAAFTAPLVVSLLLAPPAGAVGSSRVAALQVGLRSHGLYAGPVDGVEGPGTARAVKKLQQRAGLAVDGVVGPATRKALGRYGRPELGSRALKHGAVGWDVARLQFLLAWHGFPSGAFDGRFGPRTDGALRRFQRWAGLGADGVLGPATLNPLEAAPARSPIRLLAPVPVAPTDGLGFGPRGNRFHTGLDFPAPAGTPVAAAAAGRVAYAAWHPGGWGYLVTIAHGSGLRTMYAHLARIDVRVGRRIAAGALIGAVGSSGIATGAHLHFEARLRGAAIDPLPALG
jgi:murein DD-endopeptidase MepM/ murein hydrolase activator NlpD